MSLDVTTANVPLIAETFYTIQGEGPRAGRPAFFIRFGGCNLTCTWCDTPYTWAFTTRQAAKHKGQRIYDPREEMRRVPVATLVEEIRQALPNGGLVVFTGGEPMLQQRHLADIIRCFTFQDDMTFEVETAGTIKIKELETLPCLFNVSPKLAHSGNDPKVSFRLDVLEQLRLRGANFKFVVRHATEEEIASDLLWITLTAKMLNIPASKIWIMPEGTTVEEILSGSRAIIEGVKQHHFNLAIRVHTLLWGSERGR